jgi:hypothetical protein
VTQPKVFLCYASDWQSVVEVLYDRLSAAGCQPWMDKRDLMPGAPWKEAIEDAIRDSDIFVPCVTRQFNRERRFLQREIKIALDVLQEAPTDVTFVIPVRLEPDCDVPRELSRYQWLNYFEPLAASRLVESIAAHTRKTLTVPIGFISWEKAPVGQDQFSPRLLDELNRTLSGVVSWVRRLETDKIDDNRPALPSALEEVGRSVSRQAGLDIELTIFDASQRYLLHPWREMVGSSLNITFLNTSEAHGFNAWFWNQVRAMGTGYLSWVDQSSSDASLGAQIYTDSWQRHQRRTVVAFHAIPMGSLGTWTIAIEGHEIGKVK